MDLFLRTKDEAFSKFKEWKLEVENHTTKKGKCLQINNGLEYCNIRFDDFCKEFGIKRHMMCVYTQQQNGVSEIVNITIMEMVRCMLAESEWKKYLGLKRLLQQFISLIGLLLQLLNSEF